MILPSLLVSALPLSALADHLWQSTVFALAIWLLTLLLRDNQARIRYALWLAASLKFLVPFSLLVLLGSLLPQPHRTAAAAPEAIYSAVDLAAQPFTQWAPTPVAHPAPTPAELLAVHLPAILLAFWITGALAVLLTWYVRWRSLNQTLRLATPADTGRELHLLRRVEAAIPRRSPLPLRLSAELIEPGLFGIFRPVLVWPQRLTPQLHDEHIEAILTHELMHARRRDNLTAALHMLVESVLWFHPLVWWIGRRLIDERERACDEAVVQLGGRPEAYAESLLKACRFCIESPLPCVSGITGADLSQRVRSIMAAAFAAKLTLSRKLLLIAAAASAIAAPLAIGQIAAISNALTMARFMQVRPPAPPPPPPPPPGWKQTHRTGPLPSFEVAIKPDNDAAQTATTQSPVAAQAESDSAAKHLAFEVVSIRENKSGSSSETFGFPSDSDRFRASNTYLVQLIEFAYGIQNPNPFDSPRVAGLPGWAASNRYDIEAKIAPADVRTLHELTPEQRMLLLKPLLSDRFRLQAHFENRQQRGFDLVVLQNHHGVAGLHTANPQQSPDPPAVGLLVAGGNVTGHAVTTSSLARFLQTQVAQPVVDRTGLHGAYDLHLTYIPRIEERESDPTAGPSIFTAVQEQLGLKLVPRKETVPVLVIDHLEKPSVDGAEVVQAASVVPASLLQEKATQTGVMSAPVLIYSVQPEFTERARKAKASGDVLVNLWVDERGNPKQVRTLRGLGMGLDEKAVEAVKQYRFRPAMLDGKPLPTQLNVIVKFQVF
jgi:uncharacterized protein (TIGR03435 family)